MDRIPPEAARPSLDPEDFYFEGPNMVFTAAYHLKRGDCCGSGCRHCPYGHANVLKANVAPNQRPDQRPDPEPDGGALPTEG